MLEIAGGILLAIFILIVVLAFLRPILIGLYVIFVGLFLIAIIGGGVWLATTYSEVLMSFSEVLMSFEVIALVLGIVAFAGFCVWTHVDTRFHRPVDPSEMDRNIGGGHD